MKSSEARPIRSTRTITMTKKARPTGRIQKENAHEEHDFTPHPHRRRPLGPSHPHLDPRCAGRDQSHPRPQRGAGQPAQHRDRAFRRVGQGEVRRQHHRSRRRIRAARQRAVAAHEPADRRRQHDGQQPGLHVGARAGDRGAWPALPVRGQRRRLQGAGRPDRRGARAALRQGPDGAARLVGQRHPPHHQQQAARS